MKLFGRDIQGHAKTLVVLVSVLLVASGLCGIQVAILDSRQNGMDSLAAIFALTGILELGVMLIALAGIVGVSMAWAISHFFHGDDRSQMNITQGSYDVTSQSDEHQQPMPSDLEKRDEESNR